MVLRITVNFYGPGSRLVTAATPTRWHNGMDPSVYAVEAEVEASHWWFAGRRKLLGRIIGKLNIPKDARVLDIGTSTGTNLRMLRELGFVRFEGLDASDNAVRLCAEKGLGKVTNGTIEALPFEDDSFDLVLATDIIEHVDDDTLALSEIQRVLKRGAPVILTVPAFQMLWGLQDEVAHHKRRYRRADVMTKIGRAGLIANDRFYFNYLLFLPIFAARRLIRLLGIKLNSENELNNPVINAVLKKIFAFDVWSSPLVRPPFGVSFLAVAYKDRKRNAHR